MTTTKQYDVLNRLTAIESRAGVSPASPVVSSHAYRYNAANQRMQANCEGGGYAANFLNQYSGRTVPGAVDAVGVALAGSGGAGEAGGAVI